VTNALINYYLNSYLHGYLYHSYKGGFILRYFYEMEIDKYIYYRIPKPLFSSMKYKDMSPLSKILYGILLDRCTLSRANGWVDKEGRVFFYYTVEDACEMLNMSNKTVIKAFKELEKYDLLQIVRQGLRKPNILYLGQYELST
jgi:hypothetical protein